MVGEVGVVCAMSNWDGCGLPCVETSLWLGVLQVILGWWGTLGQVFLGCNMSNVNTINKTNKHIEHHVKIFMSKEFYFIILYPKEWWLEALALWAMRDITHMSSTHSNFINGSSPTVPSVTTFFVALLNGRSWLTPTTASELSPTPSHWRSSKNPPHSLSTPGHYELRISFPSAYYWGYHKNMSHGCLLLIPLKLTLVN